MINTIKIANEIITTKKVIISLLLSKLSVLLRLYQKNGIQINLTINPQSISHFTELNMINQRFSYPELFESMVH